MTKEKGSEDSKLSLLFNATFFHPDGNWWSIEENREKACIRKILINAKK